MSQVIEQVRNVCALGAFNSVLAIHRAVPVLHAGPGCGQKLWGALSEFNGYQGSGYAGGHSVTCTNSSEKEVIFGGEERLREVIANALQVIDADLYVVLTGCAADIVGDDVAEVAREFQAKGKPVVYAETGGFKGNNFFGHELVVDAIIDQYVKPSNDREPGLVNVWSVVPFQDAFWTGNLHAIRDLLAAIGLKPNVIFGPGQGVQALQKIPKAQFNLLVSPWVGLKNVRRLEEKFGTPYLHYPVLPIGPTETANFLRTVGEFAGLPAKQVEEVIKQREDDYFYYIERSADVLLETRLLPRRFITVSDSFYSLGIARFLINDLGLLPETQFITDNTPPEYQEKVADRFKFVDDITAPVVFSPDAGVVRETLREIDFLDKPLILGSAWDRVLARELKGYQLSVSLPVSNRLVLNRAYVGYNGALRLTEDIYTTVLSEFQ